MTVDRLCSSIALMCAAGRTIRTDARRRRPILDTQAVVPGRRDVHPLWNTREQLARCAECAADQLRDSRSLRTAALTMASARALRLIGSVSHPAKRRALAAPALAASIRASFSTSAPARSIHFDTQSFVSKLESEGLSRQQAVGIMEALEDVVQESIRSMMTQLVTRSEQDKALYTQKVDFAKLKSEIQLVEKQDFAVLKAENERLLSDVERLKQRLREEISRTSAGVRLDLSLEKGRTRDELAARELKIRDVDSRIEGEVQGLRATVAQNRFATLQYLLTTLVSATGLLFAYLRACCRSSLLTPQVSCADRLGSMYNAILRNRNTDPLASRSSSSQLW